MQVVRRCVPEEQLTILEPADGPSGSPAGNFLRALTQVDLTNFEYVAFSDQDDVWSPNKLERALHELRRTSSSGYSCDLIAFDNQHRCAWYIAKSQPEAKLDYLFQGASAGCTYVLTKDAARLVASKVQKHIANFPRQRSHDWLIYAICRSHGLAWIADTSAQIFYRQHGANAFGAMPNSSGLLARLQLSRTRWYRDHVRWLEDFIKLTENEADVLARVSRLSIRDRLWLACRVSHFRRTPRDRALLAIALLLGWF